MAGSYHYKAGEFPESNLYKILEDRDVIIPQPIGTSNITTVKKRGRRGAHIKMTFSFAIPEGHGLDVEDISTLLNSMRVPILIVALPAGTLIVDDERAEEGS